MTKHRISITPSSFPGNSFVDDFAQSVRDLGFTVIDARWNVLKLVRSKISIVHWPSSFFDPKLIKFARRRLFAMRIAKRLGGTKFIWVAHNAVPHDTDTLSHMAQPFLKELDGIIHLSQAGSRLVNSYYCIPEYVRQMVTVHGRYLPETQPASLLDRAPHSVIRAICFGAIRPYKNIDSVLSAASQMEPGQIEISIVGKSVDKDYAKALMDTHRRNNRFDLRNEFLSTRELERKLDDHDLAILPYTNILNSGSAFLSLSRHRPIVAPSIGSLPELQSAVGKEWVYLYHGDFTPSVMEDSIRWFRETPRSKQPNLEDYSWDRVRKDLEKFFISLHARR